MELHKIAAFSIDGKGGNPAGVAVCDSMPPDREMLRIAGEIGYSETAFLVRREKAWRVRYFSPAIEVPFCGHATIASGAVLGERHGAGIYPLILNRGTISVEASLTRDQTWEAALQSPETSSRPAPVSFTNAILAAFELSESVLDERFPIRLASAGAWHLIVFVKNRSTLAAMHYPFEQVAKVMTDADVTTISLLWCESSQRFHARNPFPVGGIYEDPATGAAAAALAGYLRDTGWPAEGSIEILQGKDMGSPSRLVAQYGPEPGQSVRVSGLTRRITDTAG